MKVLEKWKLWDKEKKKYVNNAFWGLTGDNELLLFETETKAEVGKWIIVLDEPGLYYVLRKRIIRRKK